MNDFPDVVGAFSDADETVINWRGDNFYKACGAHVVEHSDGTRTSCVKRLGHHTDVHEDFDGVIARDFRLHRHDGSAGSPGDDCEKDVGINVDTMPKDMYVGKADGPIQEGDSYDFIQRHLAWERAKDLVDIIVERYPLEEYAIRPSGFSIGFTTNNTKADQYLDHVEHLANWLLGIED